MPRYIYEPTRLPKDFVFPKAYLDLISRVELQEPTPWWFLATDQELALFWFETLAKQYPNRLLVPFAKRGYSDDVACFDGKDTSGNPKVLHIHAFASEGWEYRGEDDSFEDWLKDAVIESKEYLEDE